MLEELSCRNARLVVLSINDAKATELATRTIRAAAPDTIIIVRAQYEMDKDSLRAAGATHVITAEAMACSAIVRTSLAALPITKAPPGDPSEI